MSQAIEVVVGPYRSGKTSRLLQLLIEYVKKKPFDNVVVVVPSARIKSLLEERLLSLLPQADSPAQASGYFGVRILSFYQVCQLVLQKYGVPFSTIPDNIRLALLGRVMSRMNCEGKLQALQGIAKFKGTCASVLGLIDEFQRAALSADEVGRRLGQTAAASCRLTELSSIYKAYWQELESLGLRDQHLLAFVARQLLMSSAKPVLSLDWLLVDGFDRFNRLQLQLLEGLSQHCRETTITFDYVDSSTAAGEEYEQDYLWKAASYQQLLDYLHLNCLTPAVKNPPKAPRKTTVFSALDRYLEVSEIAGQCKKLICHEKVAAANIMVVVRDLQSYKSVIEPAFGDVGIPFFVDESVAICELPIVQYLLGLLKLSVNGFRRAQVIACLRSRYCQLSAFGLTAADVDLVDEKTLSVGLVGGSDRWQKLDLDPEYRSAAEGIQLFVRLVEPPAGIKTVTDFCVWCEDLFDRMLERLPEVAVDWADIDAHHALSGVRSAVKRLVEEEQILGSQMVSYDDFLNRLNTAVDESNFRRVRKHKKAITVCGADYAPNRMFDHVFIAGLLEGEFPRKAASSGFVSADELALWASFGVDMQNPRHHSGFEWALYRSLVERAASGVHLSFPRYDMTAGNELVPSFFVTDGDKGKEQSIPYIPPFSRSAVCPVSARSALSACLWFAPQAPVAERLLNHPAVDELWGGISSPLAAALTRTGAARENIYNGCITALVAAGALKVVLPPLWSVSALNDYGQCPFRFWVSRLLRAQRRQEPEVGLEARLLGQAYHKVLELFFRRLKERQLSVRAAEEVVWQQLLELALGETVQWLELLPGFYPGPFWHYDKLEMRFRLKRFVSEELKRCTRDDELFEPEVFEVMFGSAGQGAFPALIIEDSQRQVLVTGVVDRIDISGPPAHDVPVNPGIHADTRTGSRVRVVDYKSGSTQMPVRDAADGCNLQIPIYALAAERVILPGSKAVRGSYLSIAAAAPVGQFDFAGDEHQLLQAAEHYVLQYADAVERGDFSVRPSTAKACKYCQHAKICRVGELAAVQEVESDQSD